MRRNITRNQEIAMTTFREQRASCLIEAGARDLDAGRHWRPWLRLTRPADGKPATCTLDRLKPVFGNEQSALAYAAELGRHLADEGWGLGRESPDDRAAAMPPNQVSGHSCSQR